MNETETRNRDVVNFNDEEYNLVEMSYEDLLDLKNNVQESLRRCNTQIQTAKTNAAAKGEYSDADWYTRVHGARRFFGWLDQRIATELGIAKRKEKEESNARFHTAMMEILRRRLDKDTLKEILDEAHDKVNGDSI